MTVVIPNFLRVKRLSRAIESVLNQSYENFDLLVVDDCSPNIENIRIEIKNIQNKYNFDRISLIVHDRNMGGAAARNTGIRFCETPFIAFLDSDDEWTNDKLELQLKIIYEKKMQDNDFILYTQYLVKGRKFNSIRPNRKIKNNELLTDYLFVNNGFMQTSGLLLNTSMAKKFLFDEKLRRHQDHDFLFKIFSCRPLIEFISKPLVIVHWEEKQDLRLKKWTPDMTEYFMNTRFSLFSKKSYESYYFSQLIYNSFANGYKLYALKKIFSFFKQNSFRFRHTRYLFKSFLYFMKN